MSLSQFNASLDAFAQKDIPGISTKMVRAFAALGLRGVVLKNPVDEGRSQAGWEVTIDKESTFVPGEAESYPSKGEVINRGLSVIAGAHPFALVIIQNNVEYIEELEDGHSDQAPAGMLRVTVAELEALR